MVIIEFLIIDYPSTFNEIIRRPQLKSFKAVTFIYHLIMKFPIAEGMDKSKGSV